jgi:mono/diheme cytochrome c family protein
MFRPSRSSWWTVPALAVLAPLAFSGEGSRKKPHDNVSVAVAFNGELGSDDTATVAGSSLFKTYCATCHGVEAKGDGPLADQLRVRPPDLTRFAQRNGGAMDKDKARRIIDGRDPVKGHGGPDMPVWGDVFKRAEEGFSDKKAQQRIDALVAYVADIQRAQ